MHHPLSPERLRNGLYRSCCSARCGQNLLGLPWETVTLSGASAHNLVIPSTKPLPASAVPCCEFLTLLGVRDVCPSLHSSA